MLSIFIFIPVYLSSFISWHNLLMRHNINYFSWFPGHTVFFLAYFFAHTCVISALNTVLCTYLTPIHSLRHTQILSCLWNFHQFHQRQALINRYHFLSASVMAYCIFFTDVMFKWISFVKTTFLIFLSRK